MRFRNDQLKVEYDSTIADLVRRTKKRKKREETTNQWSKAVVISWFRKIVFVFKIVTLDALQAHI